MKRILIISYYWPPTGGSGVQRWVKFAKYLPQEGWQPVIYTPENPERLAVDESLLADVPECAEVIKTRISEPYDLYRKFVGGASKAEGGVNPVNAGKKSFKQKLALLVRGNCFIPDPRVSWVKPSVRFLVDYLKEHPVDAVVTTGPPQSVHLIGRGLKRATGIRWIADFRDPWTRMFSYKHLGLLPFADRKHHELEQSVLDEADCIIAVTPRVQEDFARATSTPVRLITNGFDQDDFDAEPKREPGRFTIVHTGLFAADGNPLKLWDALARKCTSDRQFRSALQIKLIGKTDKEIVEAIRSRGLGSNLQDLGYLPHAETVSAQKGADILMLPLRQEPEYAKVYPGKLFEYLAARRPVLGIGQEDGACAAVLAQTGAGVMYDWDKLEPVQSFIDAQWERFKIGDNCPIHSDISKYERKVLTQKLVELL